MSNIVTEQQLKADWGIKHRPKLVRYLVAKGIPFDTTPSGEVWTVQRALDDAIIKPHHTTEQSNDWDFEDDAEEKKHTA